MAAADVQRSRSRFERGIPFPYPHVASACSSCQACAIWTQFCDKHPFKGVSKDRFAKFGRGKVDFWKFFSPQIRLPHRQMREVITMEVASKLDEEVENVSRRIGRSVQM